MTIRTLVAVLLLLLLSPLPAVAWDRGQVETFATLPDGAVNPEGITVDDDGNVYVGLFAFRGTPTGRGQILVYSPQGVLLRTLDVQNSSPALLDMAFNPKTGDFLVIDFGGAKVLKVDPFTGASTVFTTIPGGGSAGPNVLTFDKRGNVYISDSFQGVIWKTGKNGGTATAWVSSPLLATSGVPPFGANGLAFNKAGSALFVANTGNDTVVRVPVNPNGSAGAPAVFVNSINGADGLIIDDHDNLWVVANQADEIVVLDPTGRVIAKLGDFGGIDAAGRPIGFLFPASLVRRGNTIFVTNLSLDLRLFGLVQAVDSQWAAQATRHTVSKINATIPAVPGLP